MNDTEAAAWAVIVQHLQHPQQLCSLLCVCKELRSLIHAKCQGQLQISFAATSLEQQRHFAQWLTAHSSLLSNSLKLQLWHPLQRSFSASIQQITADDVNGEIQEATDLPTSQSSSQSDVGLDTVQSAVAEQSNKTSSTPDPQLVTQLQNRKYEAQQQLAVAAAAAVIQSIPTHISHLELHCESYPELASYPSVMAAFEGLTDLCELNLDSSVTVCSASIFKALSGLSKLRKLVLNRVIGVSKLQNLPASLETLDLGICSPGLHLAHLTRLTSLRSQDRFLPIQSNDFLPPNLQQLVAGECHSVQRLVQLKNLISLDIGASQIPARRLQRLAASLTNLTEVKLSYHSGFNEAAAAWSDLPLKHLDIQPHMALEGDPEPHRTIISAATVQELGKLTGLTYLHTQHLDALEATKQQLAEMLSALTALQGLKLWAAGPWPLLRDDSCQQQQQQQHRLLANISSAITSSSSSSRAQAAAAAAAPAAAGSDWPSSPGSIAIMRAIANLPDITNVSLSLQNLGQTAAAGLAAATKLTSLKLRACGVGDATVEHLAQHLTGLRSLFAEYNRDISDEVLQVIEKDFLELTELDLRYTGISEHGKQYLRTLQQLKQLQV